MVCEHILPFSLMQPCRDDPTLEMAAFPYSLVNEMFHSAVDATRQVSFRTTHLKFFSILNIGHEIFPQFCFSAGFSQQFIGQRSDGNKSCTERGTVRDRLSGRKMYFTFYLETFSLCR